jgi:glycerol kinase
MQFQADILGIPMLRPKNSETTTIGSAYLAAVAVGFYKSMGAIAAQWAIDRTFQPRMPAEQRDKLRVEWNKTLGRAKT